MDGFFDLAVLDFFAFVAFSSALTAAARSVREICSPAFAFASNSPRDFALFAVGNVVFQLINDRSELMKFTSVTAFSVLVLVSVFVSGSVMEEDMLYFAYRSTVHEFMVSHLVVPGGAASYDEDDEA